MSGLEDRTIVVTGAGGGLGREYALFLARNGAQVVVNDLGGARDGSGAGTTMADAVVEEIVSNGGRAAPSYDSVASAEGAAAIIETAISKFGAVHGIVSNAGILRDRSFHKMTDGDWNAVMQVHLNGGYNVVKAAWPYFRQQQFGRIVVASSTSGLFGSFGQANYGAAKAGLVGLINTLAVEGAKYDIGCNAVAPLAATRMTADVTTPETLDRLRPELVAPAVGYLMSYTNPHTGGVFVVGGGRVYRLALFENKGVRFDQPPTLDEMAAQWPAIQDMTLAVPGVNPV